MHAFDFREIDSSRGRLNYREFENLMKWLIRHKQIRIKTFSQMLSDLTQVRLLCVDSEKKCLVPEAVLPDIRSPNEGGRAADLL